MRSSNFLKIKKLKDLIGESIENKSSIDSSKLVDFLSKLMANVLSTNGACKMQCKEKSFAKFVVVSMLVFLTSSNITIKWLTVLVRSDAGIMIIVIK